MSINKYRDMIRKWDDPILRQVCAPVEPGETITFLELMKKCCGAGLAAPQVGIAKRVVFICPRGPLSGIFLINPEIVDRSHDMDDAEEGCLSYPKVYTQVLRPDWVEVTYLDLRRIPQKRRFHDFGARVVFHELDHLDGICQVGDAWRARRLVG